MIQIRLQLSDATTFNYSVPSDPGMSLGERKLAEIEGLQAFMKGLSGTELIQLSGQDISTLKSEAFQEAFFINPAYIHSVRAYFVSNEEN